jgi:hypothetical protein
MSYNEAQVRKARYVESIRLALLHQRRGEVWGGEDYAKLQAAIKKARDNFGGDELLPEVELSIGSFTVRFAPGYADAWRAVYRTEPGKGLTIA